MVRVIKFDAEIRKPFRNVQTRRLLPITEWLLPRIETFLPEDVEGFFQRALALYVPIKFLKNGAVSLMDLPELRLGLP